MTTLRELMDEEYLGNVQLGLLLDAGANGEDVAKELATLNAHLDRIEAQIKSHPDSVWRSLEIVEMARLR